MQEFRIIFGSQTRSSERDVSEWKGSGMKIQKPMVSLWLTITDIEVQQKKRRLCKGTRTTATSRYLNGYLAQARTKSTAARTSSPENVTSPFCCQMCTGHLGIKRLRERYYETAKHVIYMS